jgi:hypothetical protein
VPFRDAGRVLRAVAAAAAVLLVVVGGSFALQAASLGRPPRARIEAVQALRQLRLYHRSSALVTIGARTYRTTCVQRWRHRRTARVDVAGGRDVLEVGHRLDHPTRLAQTQFELAGCPRPLLEWLASQLVRGAAVDFSTATVDGMDAYRLRVPGAHPPLDVYVGTASDLPVALALRGHRMRGRSDVAFGRRHGE